MSTVPALRPVVPIGDVIEGNKARATPEMQRWMALIEQVTRDYEKRIAALEASLAAVIAAEALE